jgi:hypothetical protein
MVTFDNHLMVVAGSGGCTKSLKMQSHPISHLLVLKPLHLQGTLRL